MNDESRIESLLENLPPGISPRLEKHLASAPWTPHAVKRRQTFTVISLTIAILIAFIGLTPQGRAFAQTIFKFFTSTDKVSLPLSKEEVDLIYTPAPSFSLPLVEVTPAPPLPGDCSKPEAIGTYPCEVQRIENQLGIDLKEFPSTPDHHTFTKIWFYEPPSRNTNIIVIWYQYWYQSTGGLISLTQGVGDFPPDSDWEKAPVSAIKSVKIGKYDGEYVNGSFGLLNGETRLTWAATGQRIRWKEEDRWFEILDEDSLGMPGYLDKQGLVSLASSMVYQPAAEQNPEVSLDFIPNIALAEKICKCNLLKPTELPPYMALDYIRYDSQSKSVTLSYGWNALRIVQTPIESATFTNLDSYQDVETVRVGDVVGQYGISPAEKTMRERPTSSAYFPVDDAYSVLLWQKNGTVYQIYFNQTYSNGGQLTKEQMVEIAESLH
jgi:hypothetical protein